MLLILDRCHAAIDYMRLFPFRRRDGKGASFSDINRLEKKMILGKYSMGMGDRFGHQGKAQLQAIMKAAGQGVEVTPVWNKSNREHKTIGTAPVSLRQEADDAIRALGWKQPYFVDADHINGATVDWFIECSDFFTLDVADYIGTAVSEEDVKRFVEKHASHVRSLDTAPEVVAASVRKYLGAVREAAAIYKRIAAVKGSSNFVTEVSMDETDIPQSPLDLYLILAAIADEGIPAATIAPRFSGRFNKGVDYVGDVAIIEQEFEADVRVIARAIRDFGLPAGLKLSVHSGSDKFSIYPAIANVIRKHGAGLHLKTAGTTWLEEVIGLAEAGGEALALAVEIYEKALAHCDDLCRPYASVIDIRSAKLPAVAEVRKWSADEFVQAVRHDSSCPRYNPDMRQLLHVGYKVAAEMGARYLTMLEKHEEGVARNVTTNIYDRHLKRLFNLR